MKHIRQALLACITLLLLAIPGFAQNIKLKPHEAAVLAGSGLVLICCGWAIFLMLLLTIVSGVVCFLLTMQKTLSRISPHNRLMAPSMVWLNMIPGFHLVWQFVIAMRVPGSLKNEFRDRGRDNGTGYGKLLGLAYCFSTSLGVVLYVLLVAILQMTDGRPSQGHSTTVIGVSGITFQVIALVTGILFWVKIAGYSKQLASDEFARPNRRDALDEDDAPMGWRRKKTKRSEGIQDGDDF